MTEIHFVVEDNVADLSACRVPTNAKEDDLVLLVGQDRPAQNGVYRLGACVDGVAPLLRASMVEAAR